LVAEALGTFALVGIGSGAAAVNGWAGGSLSTVGIALAFGCVVLAVVYAVGHISGAHVNPAVTVGFWAGGRFPGADVVPYIAAQLIGATAAAAGLRLVVGHAVVAAATTPVVTVGAAFGVEFVLTFLLMLVIMAVSTDARVTGSVAGLAVGATVAAGALVGGPLTGAGMNPARSFGPALVAGRWTSHWIYWLAPLAGATLAAWTYDYLRQGTAHDHRVTRRDASAPGPLSLHRQFGAQSDGRGAAQP
jgi:aquaporin Z